jgi:hypothetical protein
MGQEINRTAFSKADFERFQRRLEEETRLLGEMIRAGRCSSGGPFTGFELEGWLVDEAMRPAPANAAFLKRLNDPLASPELAKFNVEFNNLPVPLRGGALARLHDDLERIWHNASRTARSLGMNLLMIGILPTIEERVLNLDNMSDSNRFRALNEQIFLSRNGPVSLDILGRQHLKHHHDDVMLEAAATSFQIHWQIPQADAPQFFNAAIMASAPVVAISENSPYLFGADLWAETRIPLFEQAVAAGGYSGAAYGPLRRVSFGSGYVRESMSECFEENLAHFPVLLPIAFDTPPEMFAHLKLHNGTIWRWNRPLVGFDPDGTPHIRIEHRVMPAGPTIADTIANAAFFYGLTQVLALENASVDMPFAQAKDNFYQAARHGLNASVVWSGNDRQRMRSLVLNRLLPQAREGLQQLGLNQRDAEFYLDIAQQRVRSGLTGSEWQRGFIERHPSDFAAMTRCYLSHQLGGRPVHEWELT